MGPFLKPEDITKTPAQEALHQYLRKLAQLTSAYQSNKEYARR